MGCKATDGSASLVHSSVRATGVELPPIAMPAIIPIVCDFRGSDPAARPSGEKIVMPMQASAPSLFGRITGPVAAVLLTAVLTTGCATNGAPLADVFDRDQQVVAAEGRPSTPDFDELVRDLEAWRDGRRIDAAQFERVREILQRSLVLRDGTELPRDHRGRVDLDVLVTQGLVDTRGRKLTRGEIVMERLSQQLEYKMRITARDMVDPTLRRLDGAPGYKELGEREMRKMILDALRDIPLNELPGGTYLANLVKQLPNSGHLDAANMSFRQIESQVGDANEDWLKAKFRPLIDGHELEVGIVALGAVTGLRYASPEAAKLMDGLSPRATIYRFKGDDGLTTARARLAWRDQHVLPDLDLEGHARWKVRDTTFRAGIDATLSTENDDIFSATATTGAHWRSGHTWIDTSGAYRTDVDRWRANVSVGHYDPATTWSLSTGLTGTFGDGVAVGDASGRLMWETDATRELELGRAVGDFGFYAGFGVDSDGDHGDVQAGVVFRLRF